MAGENETPAADATETPEGDTQEPTVLADDEASRDTSQEGDDKPAGENEDGKGENKEDDDGAEGAPEKYEDFTVPEGITVDEKQASEFGDLARELNLTQEQAQKLVDFEVNRIKGKAEADAETWATMRSDWLEEAKADKAIGGANFEENVEKGKAALKQFGTPELTEVLETFGIGNHVEVIRFAARVADEIGEDLIVPGGGDGGGAPKTLAQRLYGNK